MPTNENAILELPARDRVRVLVENGTIKILQEGGGADDSVWLCPEDALRVADALKSAAVKLNDGK